MPIDLFGIALLILVAVILPALAILTAKRMEAGGLPMPRPAFYLQTIALQIVLLAIAIGVARTNRIPLLSLPPDPLRAWTAAALFLAIVLLALRAGWGFRSRTSKERLDSLLPHDQYEMHVYFGLCAAAAVSEEVVFRGVTFALLSRLMPLAGAAVVCAIVFAVSHAVQGWRSVAFIVFFALGFQAVVWFSESLLPAIAAHFLYDLIAGVLVPRWLAREA